MVKLAFALTLLLAALAVLASELAGPCHFGECEWAIVTDSGYGTLRVVSQATNSCAYFHGLTAPLWSRMDHPRRSQT